MCAASAGRVWVWRVVMVAIMLFIGYSASAQSLKRGSIRSVTDGVLIDKPDSVEQARLDSLANIPDELHLIAPEVIDPIQHLKVDHLGNRNPRLHTDEVLIALSISAATDPTAEKAMEKLGALRGCEVHSSVILSQVDEKIFKRLGINLTCQARFKG